MRSAGVEAVEGCDSRRERTAACDCVLVASCRGGSSAGSSIRRDGREGKGREGKKKKKIKWVENRKKEIEKRKFKGEKKRQCECGKSRLEVLTLLKLDCTGVRMFLRAMTFLLFSFL